VPQPSPATDRVEGRALPLLWQGPFFDASGYSEESRCLVYACASQDTRIAARDWPTWPMQVPLSSAQRAAIDGALSYPEPAAPYVEVFHKTILPASRATLYPQTGPTVLRTMFETDSLPAGWAPHVSRFDRVWVPSSFNVETFAAAGVPEAKLRVFPQTLNFAMHSTALEPLPLPHGASGRRFLSVLEFTERKGWRGLLDAWADAFSPLDEVSLVMKCSGLVLGVDDARARIKAYVGERPTAPIVVIEDQLSSLDMVRLFRACDAFVLPSRGEGWGRPFMEAMANGLPTIGPAWGGNLAFMSNANSFLLEGELVPVTPGDLVFERYVGQRWFEASHEGLVDALQTVAGGGPQIVERGARASREIRDRFSHARVVARLDELVHETLTLWADGARVA
jgi:glycosyltransferase involved in cell wall biosynthesis